MSFLQVKKFPTWSRAAFVLAGIALVCSSLMVFVYHSTETRIANQQQRQLTKQLHAVLPADLYNNDLMSDTLEVSHALLGTTQSQTIWRARYNGQH